MPALREALGQAGYGDVQTYVQSGNVVLSSDSSPEELADHVHGLIAENFELDIAVVVRTHEELVAVVKRDPLGKVASDPKRYLVSFLSAEPDPDAVERVRDAGVGEERVVLKGRELYAWLPDGVGRSKLWAALASGRMGVDATARNWATVTRLLAISSAV